jgi:hypothetical protein
MYVRGSLQELDSDVIQILPNLNYRRKPLRLDQRTACAALGDLTQACELHA